MVKQDFLIPSQLEVVLTNTGLALIGESSYHTGPVLMMREAVFVLKYEVEDQSSSLSVDPGKVYQAYLSRRELLSEIGLQERFVQKHHKEVYKPSGI